MKVPLLHANWDNMNVDARIGHCAFYAVANSRIKVGIVPVGVEKTGFIGH